MGEIGQRQERTIRLVQALDNLAFLGQVNEPALCVAGGILQSDAEYSLAILDGVLPVSLVGIEGVVDGVKRHRRRKLVC